MCFFGCFDISHSETIYEIYQKLCSCHIFCVFIILPTSLKNVQLLSNALGTICGLKKSSWFTGFIVILTQTYIYNISLLVFAYFPWTPKNVVRYMSKKSRRVSILIHEFMDIIPGKHTRLECNTKNKTKLHNPKYDSSEPVRRIF